MHSEASLPSPAEPDADTIPEVARSTRHWTITLRRPRQHNRLDPADVTLLQQTFDALLALAPSQRPRLLVLRGTGSKTFSSGYTLQAILEQLDERFEAMLDTLERLPVVTVAAMQGNVYGGATDLALCCDLRFGPADMRMFMPAARIGLHYYPHGLRRYLNRLGATATSKLMLTGETVGAEELLRMGFLTEIVERDAMEERLARLFDAVAATEPNAVAAMKQSLLDLNAVAQSALDAARLRYLSSLQSEELRSRLAALGKA
jgi:enoyl-CoA hydratase/carnithine racemase